MNRREPVNLSGRPAPRLSLRSQATIAACVDVSDGRIFAGPLFEHHGFAVAREAARRWPKTWRSSSPRTGRIQATAKCAKGRLIGKPFLAGMVHDHLANILPDGRKPSPWRATA